LPSTIFGVERRRKGRKALNDVIGRREKEKKWKPKRRIVDTIKARREAKSPFV
jgi:hypothetical protein